MNNGLTTLSGFGTEQLFGGGLAGKRAGKPQTAAAQQAMQTRQPQNSGAPVSPCAAKAAARAAAAQANVTPMMNGAQPQPMPANAPTPQQLQSIMQRMQQTGTAVPPASSAQPQMPTQQQMQAMLQQMQQTGQPMPTPQQMQSIMQRMQQPNTTIPPGKNGPLQTQSAPTPQMPANQQQSMMRLLQQAGVTLPPANNVQPQTVPTPQMPSSQQMQSMLQQMQHGSQSIKSIVGSNVNTQKPQQNIPLPSPFINASVGSTSLFGNMALPSIANIITQNAATQLSIDELKEIAKAFKENNYSISIENGKLSVDIGHNFLKGAFLNSNVNNYTLGTNGSTTTLACQYPTGVVELMTHTIEPDGSMKVSISDTNREKDLVSFKFHKLSGTSGWTLDPPNGNFIMILPGRTISSSLSADLPPLIIPSNATPYDIVLGQWIANFVNRNSIVKSFSVINPLNSIGNLFNQITPLYSFQTLTEDTITPNTPPAPPDAPPPPPPPNTGPTSRQPSPGDPPGGGGCSGTKCCIPHDLVCTFPDYAPFPVGIGLGLVWVNLEGDFKTVQVSGFPCAPVLNVDISSCCLNHDICYWCAQNPLVKLYTCDTTVADCIASTIKNALCSACGQFWCDFFIVALGLVWLGADIWISNILKDVWPSNPLDLLGYNAGLVGTSNYQSCLCHGTLPTYQCAGDQHQGLRPATKCRNLCHELIHPDNETGCVWCEWVCQYDEKGNYTGTKLVPEVPFSYCCPGSAGTTDFDGKTQCMPEPNQIKCQGCYPSNEWECGYVGRMGGRGQVPQWVPVVPYEYYGLPSCPNTPKCPSPGIFCSNPGTYVKC